MISDCRRRLAGCVHILTNWGLRLLYESLIVFRPRVYQLPFSSKRKNNNSEILRCWFMIKHLGTLVCRV